MIYRTGRGEVQNKKQGALPLNLGICAARKNKLGSLLVFDTLPRLPFAPVQERKRAKRRRGRFSRDRGWGLTSTRSTHRQRSNSRLSPGRQSGNSWSHHSCSPPEERVAAGTAWAAAVGHRSSWGHRRGEGRILGEDRMGSVRSPEGEGIRNLGEGRRTSDGVRLGQRY